MTKRKLLDIRQDIEFRYSEDHRTTYSISAGLGLHSGEAWCIRGISGSGKSTLLTLLAALRRFDAGRLRYDFPGEPPLDVSAADWKDCVGPDLWRRVGFAFQRPELLRALTVADNLALATSPSSEDSLFEASEWTRIAMSRVWEISGGQIQRLGLMRAFGAHQDLVFLDEPTNNLDQRNRTAVAEFVARRRQSRGLVIVSHDDEFLDHLEIDRLFEVQEHAAGSHTFRRTLVEIDPSQSTPAFIHDHETHEEVA